MPIAFSCQQCSKPYRVADNFAGKRIRCKQCQAVIEVPQALAEVAPGAHNEPNPQLPMARPMPQARPVPMPPKVAAGVAAPFGVAAPQGVGPRKVNFVFLAGAALLIFGFMTPWISIEGVIRISGFQIPYLFNKLASAMGDKSGQFLVLYFMYFIPLACLVAVVDEFVSAGKGKNRWYLRLTAALSPVIAFLLIVATFPTPKSPEGERELEERREARAQRDDGPSVFTFLGFGVWLSMGGFAVSLAGVFTSPKPRPAQVAFMPRPRKAPLPSTRPASPLRRTPKQ